MVKKNIYSQISFILTLCLLFFFFSAAGEAQNLPSEKAIEEKGNSAWKSLKEKFFLLAKFTGYGGYSELMGGSGIYGGNVNGIFIPGLKLGEKTSFILLNNFAYIRTKQVFQEDEGPNLLSESMLFTFTPAIKYDLTENFSIIPAFFQTRMWTKETTEEKWGDGLYDYTDTGGGINLNYIILKSVNASKTIQTGIQYYHRTYPHFTSLISLAEISDLEEKEKDYDGILITASYKVKKTEGLSYKVSFSSLLKDFNDKLIENAEGGRDSETQFDHVHTLGLNLKYSPGGSFKYKLDSIGSITFSNQNLAEGFFPDIDLTENYYGFYSLTEIPSVWYTYKLQGVQELSFGLAYSYTVRNFQGREARDSSGEKTGKKELSQNHDFILKSDFKINRHWSTGIIASYQIARSNNKDERVFRFNYEIAKISAGLTYTY